MLGTSIQAPTLIGCLFVKEQFAFDILQRILFCTATSAAEKRDYEEVFFTCQIENQTALPTRFFFTTVSPDSTQQHCMFPRRFLLLGNQGGRTIAQLFSLCQVLSALLFWPRCHGR
ncbi:MAG: hypothetical protein EPO06_07145 [Burkholderiaceae bacterium]|nr:MAG: hypothetical protein EPO06_07145 [Burkholderiaceae bacterium]